VSDNHRSARPTQYYTIVLPFLHHFRTPRPSVPWIDSLYCLLSLEFGLVPRQESDPIQFNSIQSNGRLPTSRHLYYHSICPHRFLDANNLFRFLFISSIHSILYRRSIPRHAMYCACGLLLPVLPFLFFCRIASYRIYFLLLLQNSWILHLSYY
jgi:hypothetical protein